MGSSLPPLTDRERAALERSKDSKSPAWNTALLCAGACIVVLISVIVDGSLTAESGAVLLLKAAGYIALGRWARNWSVPGTLGLLCWHVVAIPWTGGAFFWGPFAFLGIAMIGATTRASLRKRAFREQQEAQTQDSPSS